MPRNEGQSEWLTRKMRIDPLLDSLGWGKADRHRRGKYRLEEYETDDGPADYALCVDERILGIVEAKKVSLGPQNVLTQSERYSKGASSNPFDFCGFHVPFLYSTNGEVIWFHDIRHRLNRSRRVTLFHTPSALLELLDRDFEAGCRLLRATPNNHPRLRPYQIEANTATEKAIAERRREMLLAMATGTGKTFTLVNQAYRLIRSSLVNSDASRYGGSLWGAFLRPNVVM